MFSWHPCDSDSRLVKCVGATVEPGCKRLNDSAVLADPKLRDVPVIFVEGSYCPSRRQSCKCVNA